MAGKMFGSATRFAIEVGDFFGDGDGARRVDVWAADRWLTCDDNHVYVPHFAGMLAGEIRSLLVDPGIMNIGRPYPALSVADNHRKLMDAAVSGNGPEYVGYRFMRWGPTADNVSVNLFREAGNAFLAFSFWREDHHDPSELGQAFVAELPERELVSVLHDAAWAIMWEWADRSTR